MDVYLSARFGRRYELRPFARQLEDAGVRVTSRWIHAEADAEIPPDVAVYQDLIDVHRAQVLVAFTEIPDISAEGKARGGRHVEFGIALARGKRLLVVGPRENVFHHVEQVEVYESPAAAIARLIADADRQRRAGW